MNQSREPEDGSQRSVAELLARYGEPPAGGRRRRRALDAEETEYAGYAEDPAPPSITGRVGSHRATPPQEGRAYRGRARDDSLSRFTPAHSQPYQSSLATGPAPWSAWAQPEEHPDEAPAPYHDEGAHHEGRHFDLAAVVGDDHPLTEQLLQIDAGRDAPPAPAPRRAADRLSVGAPPAGLAPSWEPQRPPEPPQREPEPAHLSVVATPRPAAYADESDHGEQDGDDGSDDSEVPAGSPAWEWAVVASQVGAGVVGGAMLWLVCEWLWQSLPVVALVMALAVITGLVWVVRRVRHAEDLQTTVIAVLVGLFVTVSPAALLLVGR